MAYHESGCNSDGTRLVCLRWEAVSGCAKLSPGDFLKICKMNDFASTQNKWVGENICETVRGGESYSFGIESVLLGEPKARAISITGYTNGLAQCDPFVSHCSFSGSNDFKLTFQVTPCPTTAAATTTLAPVPSSPRCSCPSWSSWSACSATCGSQAMRTRTRGACSSACTSTQTQSETSLCPGVPANCPVDGRYTGWTQWSSCPVTCGGSEQTRSRTCSMPSPRFGGATCNGLSNERKPCALAGCPAGGSGSGAGGSGAGGSSSRGRGVNRRARRRGQQRGRNRGCRRRGGLEGCRNSRRQGKRRQ
ncbi:thrombospondin-2-like [Watersipora subatra]|uniref:thrombospondin-2-like n=1 Tax=Watersipora subatra TaxID=2589382 RepID=UPI00355C4413